MASLFSVQNVRFRFAFFWLARCSCVLSNWHAATHDTIQYLRNITSHLQQRYVNQLVSIISDEDIIMLRQQKKLSAPPNSGTIVYTMTQFAAANNKRANLSPQEVFATHLMVVRDTKRFFFFSFFFC
jgi:hypothetical protein